MLKKNQLVLILLTLVLMLSVYFIRSPFSNNSEENNNNDNGELVQNVSTGRLDELKDLRTILSDERDNKVLGLDAIIADSSKTIEEIDVAIKEKRYINSLTEKELLLETKIIQKGYRDSFVHCSETGIDILVVSNESSKSLANGIIVMALPELSNMNYNVSVNFQTAEEVMGNVA